jgi:guanosine-3',5'-bis(diphosphate) 3'-pyrophosphohydrolase
LNKKVLQAHLLKDFADSELLKLPNPTYKATKSYLNGKELKKIQLAYNFAFHAHDGQLRKDGTPYISHPVAVSNI